MVGIHAEGSKDRTIYVRRSRQFIIKFCTYAL